MSCGILFERLSTAYKGLKYAKDVLFNRYLFATNMGISFLSSGAGDILQQHYNILRGENETWDKQRTYNMSMTGLSVGFVCHHWYSFLDRKLPGKTLAVVSKKVLYDQILFSPFYISVFFITAGLLEKSSMRDIRDEIIQKGKHLYVAEWVVWPPAQFINFLFLPNKYRILYDSTISLGYDIYTSYVKHEKEDTPKGKVEQVSEPTLRPPR